MTTNVHADVMVIGAGVIGLTSAWRCVSAGLTVVVADPNPARGASWAAAGMLAPVTELHYGEEPLLHLNLAARDLWPAHAAALADAGLDIGYAECGSVMVARDGDDAAEYRRLMAFQQDLGMQVSWLRSREVRQLEPALAPSVRGGIRVDGDHQVDNRALVTGLLRFCQDHPNATVIPSAAAAIDTSTDAHVVTGLDDGSTVESGAVVLAAGARSPMVQGLQAIDPVRPVKGQLLHLLMPEGPVVGRNIRGRDCYIVSRPDGRMVVGATVEEQGFDDRPTAGAVRDLLQAAWELVPATAEATFVEAAVGFRPGSPDNAPLLGPLHDDPRVVIATGAYRNGVLQSPLTAAAVLAWIDGSMPPVEATRFPPDRSACTAA